MIKINLLATQKTKKKKKKVAFESQLIGLGVFSVVLLLTWFFGWRFLDQKVLRLQAAEGQLNSEMTALNIQVKAVENYEKNKKAVQNKIEVIQKLRKKQSLPVFLLNEISQRLPERVWLLSLNETAGTVELSGRATTNSEIVDFIDNLKDAPEFQNIQILESRQNKDGNVTLYSFRLKWTFIT